MIRMAKPRLEPPNWFGASSEGWRRVRVGVTGLAAIMLIVGLASAMFARLAFDAQSSPQSQASKASANEEPMAELGVAPGAAVDTEKPLPTPQP
jgi:hypothetical protein